MAFNPKTPSATSGEATATADEFHGLMERITGQSEDMLASFNSGAMRFTDMLSPSISAAGAVNVDNWGEAAMACVVAADVAEQWAEDLEWYDEKIASLQSQVDNDAPYIDDSTINPPESMTAREQFIQSLQTMADEYWVELEEKADWCSDRLAGGTEPGNVAHLLEAGRLSWLPYNLMGDEMPTPITGEDGIGDGEDLQEMLENGEIDQERYDEIMLILSTLNSRAERAQRLGEELTDGEIEYLESLYEELDKFEDYDGVEGSGGAISLPEIIEQNFESQQVKDTLLEELGGGILTLSDERLGGGLSRLPESISDTVQGPVLSANGLEMTTDHQQYGQDLKNLAAFLGNAPVGLEGGTRLSQDLSLQMGLILEDASGDTAPPFQDFLFQELGEGNMETLLDVSTRNIEANHGILTGQYENGAIDDEHIDDVVRDSLYGFLLHGESFDPDTAGETDYSEDNFERSGLTAIFDWISESGPDDQQLAAESLAGLVNFMVDPENQPTLMGNPGDTHIIGDGISRDAADSLADAFGAHIETFANDNGIGSGGTPSDMVSLGLGENFGYDPDDGTVSISVEDRVRFLEILMTDERAAVNIHADTALYGSNQIVESVDGGDNKGPATSSGNLAAIVDAALQNEALYRDIEEDAIHKEREQMFDFASSLLTGGLADSNVTSSIPGYGAVEELALNTLKDNLIEAPTANESNNANDENGETNLSSVQAQYDVVLAQRMVEEFQDNSDAPNPFIATNGDEQEADLNALREVGVITGGENEEYGDLEFHPDVAGSILSSNNETGDLTDMQSALSNVVQDTPMSWIPNDERTGGDQAVQYGSSYASRYNDLNGAIAQDDKESLSARDDQIKEQWEERAEEEESDD